MEAQMYFDQINPDLKSNFLKSPHYFSNLENETQLPTFGLKASYLLNKKQMQRLSVIRSKKLKVNQLKQFIPD